MPAVQTGFNGVTPNNNKQVMPSLCLVYRIPCVHDIFKEMIQNDYRQITSEMHTNVKVSFNAASRTHLVSVKMLSDCDMMKNNNNTVVAFLLEQ